MSLRVFQCEECGAEFAMSSDVADEADGLVCPVCGEEAVNEALAEYSEEDAEAE